MCPHNITFFYTSLNRIAIKYEKLVFTEKSDIGNSNKNAISIKSNSTELS